MSYVWSSDLETGEAAIDNQRRQLLSSVSALFDTRKSSKEQQEVKETMKFMLAYTIEHFADEEQLQKTYSYPGYREHKALHDEFKKAAQELAEELYQATPTDEFISKACSIVGGWMFNHITDEDSRMAAYVKKKKAELVSSCRERRTVIMRAASKR